MEEVIRFKAETGLSLREGVDLGSWIVTNCQSYLKVLSLIKKYNSDHNTRICCFQGQVQLLFI